MKPSRVKKITLIFLIITSSIFINYTYVPLNSKAVAMAGISGYGFKRPIKEAASEEWGTHTVPDRCLVKQVICVY